MAYTYSNPGGRIGPRTKTSKRTITNPDGTRTIITTTEVTDKGETTTTVDTQRLPSLPRIRRESVKMDDGTTGWKKTSTVVHPDGQREVTVEWPDGEKQVTMKDGPKKADASGTSGTSVAQIPEQREAVLPSWPSIPYDSALKRLGRHADAAPDRAAVSFLRTNGDKPPTVSTSITYQDLNRAVEYLAARLLPPGGDARAGDGAKGRLVQAPPARGDRILLVYPPCAPHFLISFLACVRAGLVAVPVYPPHPDRRDSVAAFVRIAGGCGARVALTSGEYAAKKRLGGLKAAFTSKMKLRKDGGEDDMPSWPEELEWVVTDREPLLDPPADFPRVGHTPEPHEAAFIQYTSGSTSAPKGVVLTHSNLAHNLHIITDELEASEDTRVVSWLPQYHDMGLIGSLLGVLYCGGSGHYMSPIAYLQRPMNWIEAVSEFRGTHLQAPNFAFGLTARKFDASGYCHGRGGVTVNEGGKKLKPLDLSCVRHVINGAEPVTEKSVGSFVKAFSPFGLPNGVIYPTYGLAEHTVFVCTGGKGKLSVKRIDLEQENRATVVDEEGNATGPDVINFLGCGFPLNQNVDVRIVEPNKRILLEDGAVGEIWVNSHSKAEKYYGCDEKETKSEFHAIIENRKDSSVKFGGYLRTGDLGFLHKEQLYICGRIKDLVIVGGRNHYPQDIERTAEDAAVGQVRPGCSAAFSIGNVSGDKGEYERVVLAMELRDPVPSGDTLKSTCEGVVAKVRGEVFKEHSLSLFCIVILKPRTIPKTTSGKIQRAKTQKCFLAKSLQELHRKEFPLGDVDVADFGDADKENGTRSNGAASAPPVTKLTPAQIRALNRSKIREMLVEAIAAIAGVEKSAIKDGAALNTYMDSVSLAQLKGLLEGQYGVKPFSDPYLFKDTTSLKKIVEIVKAGAAKDDDGQGTTDTAAGSGGPGCCGCVVM